MIIYNPNGTDYDIMDLGVTIEANSNDDISYIGLDARRNSQNLITALTDGSLKMEQSPGVYYTAIQAIRVLEGNTDPVNGLDVLSKYQFWSRFTFNEKVAMEASTEVNVKVVVKNLELAEYIDLNHPDLGPAMDLLVSYGIITSARKTEIMTI